MFSCECCEISKNTLFYRTPLGDCFWNGKDIPTIVTKLDDQEQIRDCIRSWKIINTFQANVPFQGYPLKMSEKLWLSDIFSGYRKETLVWNGLIKREAGLSPGFIAKKLRSNRTTDLLWLFWAERKQS